MLVFAAAGALDYLTGNRFGIGKEFERGVLMMGTMILSMVGMVVLAPLIAAVAANPHYGGISSEKKGTFGGSGTP
jgi:ethanolamine transporter EutH